MQSFSSRVLQMTETTSGNDVPVLRRAAMDYLARREHSLYELTQKLCKKFPQVDKNLLQEVLETLRSDGMQSDHRFTESYVRSRKSKGFAYQHIKAELSSRRVKSSLIAQYLFIDDEAWQAIADYLVEKKLRTQEPLEHGSKQHKRLSRFLKSRGFAEAEIRRTLGKHCSKT